MTITIRSVFIATIAAVILSVSLGQSARADQHEIKFRQSVMKAVGGTMGGLAAVLKGEAPSSHADPLAHTMYELSKVVPHLFPKGSDFGETAALLTIWEKPADFTMAVAAYQAAALNLSKVVHDFDMGTFGPAFAALGKSCKGCHENFRKKKEN
ncbi:MAG: cytochrome c [Rhodospirillaceae bacterium]|nr:cytochrome c [Rhodospirillaceae bacterium]MBL6929918.1 cytochrome c [Rhodospirillales bacterium]